MTIKLNYDVSGIKKQKLDFFGLTTIQLSRHHFEYLSQKSLLAFCKLSSLSAVITLAVSSAYRPSFYTRKMVRIEKLSARSLLDPQD